MKNNIIIILLFATTMLYSQTNITKTVNVNNYAEVYNRDVILQGVDSVLNFDVNFKTPGKYHYEIVLNIDSTASTSGANVQLQGKLWDTDTYANIGSVIAWTGTSSDTTIKIAEQSTLQTNQYLRLNIDGDSCTIDFIKERIYK